MDLLRVMLAPFVGVDDLSRSEHALARRRSRLGVTGEIPSRLPGPRTTREGSVYPWSGRGRLETRAGLIRAAGPPYRVRGGRSAAGGRALWAERGACAARRGGDREDGSFWSTPPSAPKAAGFFAPSGWSRRWSFRSPVSTSCVRRCSPGSSGCRLLSSEALGIAFGLTSGARPDRFLVGLAVLSLLSDAAEERPLLCLIDDAQWLDQSSSQVLAFVARRLAAESIVLVFAERESDELDALAGLPELRLEGLSDVDARELLGSVVSGPLDERVAEQLVAETHGNPLALLELPHGLSPAELAGGFALTAALPLPSLIEESFRQRVERLPADSQRLLLVAAAEPTRRSDAVVAGGRAPRSRARGGGAGRSRGPAHPRRPGHLSPPPPALGDLPRGARPTERRSAHRGSGGSHRSRRSIPIAGRGTAPRRRSHRTRTSPPSSSARPTGPEHAAASPPQPRSSSEPRR